MIGDEAAYLQDGMKVMLSVLEASPVAIELPQRVDARGRRDRAGDQGPDRVVVLQAGQLSNGVRTIVPPFIGPAPASW